MARVESRGPWAYEYSPRAIEDLVVVPKKVDEVRSWLRKYATGAPGSSAPSKRLLVLCGPAGVGKSAMLRVLCSDLDVEINEWTRPTILKSSGARFSQQYPLIRET